ncbi:aldose 1-epimerase family protein [Paenibacillus sp. GCM10027628]|uniref:aldose 1-epimerase family protein n=1 Tax=Paenibacillus sp. GCM10027628 TaxID=3273413 RepID=UPI003639C390
MNLYGKEWTRRELEARVGRIEQIAGIRRFMGVEGNEAGVEQIQVRTGAGLSYYVTPTKGLDISLAEYHGASISWQSGNGDAHPHYYEPQDNGWLRTASGGLLMTCGLMQVGSPCEDEDERLGLHGRVHHTPAKQVAAESSWHEDEMEMRISGVVEETAIFGGHLRMTRQIRSRLGQNTIHIQDEVRNMGFQCCPHMMLYHFNFGFPLLSEETTVKFHSTQVKAREREMPIEGYEAWQAPDAGYRERVYYHDSNEKPWVQIENPNFPFHSGRGKVRVSLQWSAETLPRLIQWKMPGAGTHVLGIEPANCLVEGRRKEREWGSLFFLEPGQTVNYEIRLNLE